jgi:hypothetical protein
MRIRKDEVVKSPHIVMQVPDQVRDDASGIQNYMKLLDAGFRRNDNIRQLLTFYGLIKKSNQKKAPGSRLTLRATVSNGSRGNSPRFKRDSDSPRAFSVRYRGARRGTKGKTPACDYLPRDYIPGSAFCYPYGIDD